MENNYYQIYVNSIYQLVSSIAIKSNDTAVCVNKQLQVLFGPNAVNNSAPSTWRYYLNVAGSYHGADTVMTVVSLDTLETIEFTKENLQVHTGTAKAYAYGSNNYKELLNRYPDQERLILGILYPVDLQYALDAPEGQILSYPPFLVEDTEYSFIAKLQQWINGYLIRWNNSQFMLSDNLYAASMYGIMFMNMVPAILNLRLQACKTNEVHSYHIRQYLASNGMLDSYMTYLTRRQMLFLYRNIAYIMRNSGKAAVFEWLTEHIMTQRGLPLADFQMRHDLSLQPTELRPLLSFQKRPLNTEFNVDQRTTYSVTEIMNKEDPLARDNLKYHLEAQTHAIKVMQNSLSNKQQTKLLESSTIDYSGSEHFTLADTLLYHWMYMANAGYYRTYVGIEQPSSGEILSLRAHNAFELYIYAYCKSMGITLVELPSLMTKRVMRVPKPTVTDIMSVVDPKAVGADFAQQMLNFLPSPQNHVSTSGFYDWCVQVHKGSLEQYYNVCAESRSFARAQKHALMSRCWSDTQIQLGTQGQTYDQWFSDLNFDIDGYSDNDLTALCKEILIKATGLDSSSIITLKDVQAAMVRLMGQLGSYSVQYSVTINDGAILDAPCATLRLDNLDLATSSIEKIPYNVDAIDIHVTQEMGFKFDLSAATLPFNLDMGLTEIRKQDIGIKAEINSKDSIHYLYHRSAVGVSYEPPVIANNPNGIIPVLGIDIYLGLTAEEQASIPDVWHSNLV